MCNSEVNTAEIYTVHEPGFYVGDLAVCNPVELALFKIEYLERCGHLPDIRKKKREEP